MNDPSINEYLHAQISQSKNHGVILGGISVMLNMNL